MITITAKAPCRVDLAGGTLDIWPLYLYHADAVTVNFAVDLYASCVLETRTDGKIVLSSNDLEAGETFESIGALKAARGFKLPLAAHVVKFFSPATGIEIRTASNSPQGAGIGGSSTLIIAIANALNRLTGAGYGPEQLREIAQNVEARIIKVPTGCQDYYPALYGGVSAIELRADGIVRKEIPADVDDLNERIVLAYTGAPRTSGINNWEVTKLHIDGDKKVFRNFDQIASIAHAMRGALGKGDWAEAGRLLREEWSFRRRNAPGITTPLIDRLIAATRRAGSTGAKACGAGGGGCVFFLCERGEKQRVCNAIAREGAELLPVRVAPQGVQVSER